MRKCRLLSLDCVTRLGDANEARRYNGMKYADNAPVATADGIDDIKYVVTDDIMSFLRARCPAVAMKERYEIMAEYFSW